MLPLTEEGGVEEIKEDEPDTMSPSGPRHSQDSYEVETDEQQHGFQARVEKFAELIFGSCGSAIEAASYFVQSQTCRCPGADEVPPSPQRSKPPLSIAEELRKLAQSEGRPFYTEPPARRAPDIPKFLGEEAVNSFDNDDVSALSQHTLEEMEAHGILHPFCRRRTSGSRTPPSPVRTISQSSSSSKGKLHDPYFRPEI